MRAKKGKRWGTSLLLTSSRTKETAKQKTQSSNLNTRDRLSDGRLLFLKVTDSFSTCCILGACFSAACIFCLCAGPCIVLHALSVGWVCFIFSSFRLAYSLFQCHHHSPAVGRLMVIVFSMMGFVDLSTQLPICVIQEKFGSLFCFSEHAWSIVVSSRSGFARVLVTKLADGRQR